MRMWEDYFYVSAQQDQVDLICATPHCTWTMDITDMTLPQVIAAGKRHYMYECES